MTIEQQLLNHTPLPLDIIRFCIDPFLTHGKAHWRRQFNLVLSDISDLGGGIRGIYEKGQQMRMKWAKHKPEYIVVIVTFRFDLYVPGYTITHRVIWKKLSLISRIKSWFKTHF